MKLYFFVLILFVTNACSLDTRSGIWDNKKIIDTKDEHVNISFDEIISFEEFKNKLKIYGQKSNYPNINKRNK